MKTGETRGSKAASPSVQAAAAKAGRVAWKLLLALSGAAMTLLLSQGGSVLFIGAGVLLSLAVCAVAAFRFRLPEAVLTKPKLLPLVLAVVLAVCVALLYRAEFGRTANEVIAAFLAASPLSAFAGAVRFALPTLASVLALFALYTWFYLLSDRAAAFARCWYARSDRTERLYLLVGFLLAAVAIALVFGCTNAFYGGGVPYDVVYTTDSANLMDTNAFFYVNAYENDIRQPLFAVFSMPFAVLALLMSRLLFFVPHAYPVALACVQALLMLFSFTLLARVLRLTGADKLLFLLLLSVSYPTLLFLFTMEQYVFSVFWVLVLLYLWCEEAEDRTLCYVAATGSLLTSGAFFPLLFTEKGAGGRVRSLLAAMLAFAGVFVVFGRVPLLNRAMQTARDIASFAGESVGFGARALQFLAFVSACFVRPAAGPDLTAYAHASYQMHAAAGVSWLGLALLLLAALSAALQLREKRVRVLALWAACSVLLLGVAGWGASENGMVLYTLYFFWAYAALLYTLLLRLLRRRNAARYALAAAGIGALAFFNVCGMTDLIRFAIAYYPAG